MALHPDYATLAEGRAFLRITDAADTGDDSTISLALTAASRGVDRASNRQFGVAASAAARYYTARWDPALLRYVVDIDDLMTSTGLVVKTDIGSDGVYETTITTYALEPVNAAGNGRPWTRIVFATGTVVSTAVNGLEITALWGWTAVPATIKLATLIQMSRLVKRRDAPFGIAGSPDTGSEMRLLARLDPDVELSIGDFKRRWGAV